MQKINKFDLHDGNIIIKGTLNDTSEGKFFLDTGADITFLRLKDLYLAGLNENSPEVQKTTSKSITGKYTILQTRLDSFSVGEGFEVKNLLVKAYESEIDFIGANYLNNFTITLNYQERYALFR
jgi:predicted aspartyl protease